MLGHIQRWLVFLILIFPSLLLGQTSLQIDLQAAPGEKTYSRYLGSTGNGRFGVPVCGGWDCDGDGQLDVAFAAVIGNPFGRTAAGNVTIVWGRGSELGETIDTVESGDRLLHIAGAQTREVCGAEIWMDDVDGDGLGDLLVGRQNFTPSSLRRGAGALTIIFGGPELRALSRSNTVLDLLSPPDNVRMLQLYGGSAYNRLGIWMRTGDLDGDGIADIAVGADEVDGIGELNRGEVIVLRGGPHLHEAPVIDLADFPTTKLSEHLIRIQPPPASRNGHFGATIQLGDLDGNGRAELVIAATIDRSGASIRLTNAPAGTGIAAGGLGRGAAFILWDTLFTPDRWISGREIRLTGVDDNVSRLTGGLRNLRFGEELLAGGDFDGDGRHDLFVGDLKGRSKNGVAAGLGYVFFDAAKLRGQGLNVDLLPRSIRHTVIEGVFAGALSADAAGYGDLDEDGRDDLILCSPHENPLSRRSAGSLHVVYGQREGWPNEINLAANALPANVRVAHMIGARGSTPNDVGDTLGYSLAVADANGDGTPDIITNEMQGNGSQIVDVGNLILYSGRALFPPPNSVAIETFTAARAANGTVNLRWESRWRLRYQIERSFDLQNWEIVGQSIKGTGEALTFHDTTAADNVKFFYRLLSETTD